ncbi:hypothetical protein HID58_095192, partial [Brassica napus]
LYICMPYENTSQGSINMAPTIKTIGEYKTHQDYFVDFFGDNLLVTQPRHPPSSGDGSETSSTVTVARVLLTSRRWSRRPVDTVMQDVRKLEITRHQLEIGELLDVRKYVADQQGRSLRGRMYGAEGVKLDRKISKSDWSVDYLSKEQLVQVSVDAYVSFKLGVDARLWQISKTNQMAPTIRTLAKYKFESHSNKSTPSDIDDGSEMSSSVPSFTLLSPIIVGVGVNWAPHWYFSAPPCHYRPVDTLQLCGNIVSHHPALTVIKRVPDIIPVREMDERHDVPTHNWRVSKDG